MGNTQEACSSHVIKGATILKVSRCPPTEDAFAAIFLHNVIREMEECLAPLDNIQGQLKTVKPWTARNCSDVGKPWEAVYGFNESPILLPVRQVFLNSTCFSFHVKCKMK